MTAVSPELVERRRRPLVGPLLAAVGAVVAAIEAEPALAERRGVGFWYATAGLALVAYGVTIAERERQAAPLPVSLPVTLTALGTWGVVLMPKSPFWVFGPLAVLAAVRRRRAQLR